jgi:plastocyanin
VLRFRSPDRYLRSGAGAAGPGRRALGLVAVVCLAGLAAGCAQLEYASLRDYRVPGAAATVHILDSPETVGVFDPAVVRVRPGQTVAWVNASGDYHTVTFTDPSLPPSPGFGPGESFERTFARPGTYRYVCAYHRGMVGEVVVGGAPATPGA